MTRPHALNLGDALAAIDSRDLDWFSRQPEDARIGFNPFMLLRIASAASGPQGEAMLLRLADTIPAGYWQIARTHPDLAFRLLAACGSGRRLTRDWKLGVPKGRAGHNAAIDLLARFWPLASDAEITDRLRTMPRADLARLVEGLGNEDESIKTKVLRDHDKLTGTAGQDEAAPAAKGPSRRRKAR